MADSRNNPRPVLVTGASGSSVRRSCARCSATATRCGRSWSPGATTPTSPASPSSASSATSATRALDRAVAGRLDGVPPRRDLPLLGGRSRPLLRRQHRRHAERDPAPSQRGRLPRLVYTSTVGTIGVADDGQLASEETLVHFEHLFGHYKRSKYLAEHEVLRAGAAGLPVVLVHPTFPVGEGDSAPTPTGRTIVEFLNGRIPAYVDTALNVVHVDDVARGHVLAARARRARAQLHPRRREHVAPGDAGDARRRLRAPGAPRAALAARVLPIVRSAEWFQASRAAQRAGAAVGAGADGDDPHGIRHQPGPRRARVHEHARTRRARSCGTMVRRQRIRQGRPGRAHPRAGKLDREIDRPSTATSAATPREDGTAHRADESDRP